MRGKKLLAALMAAVLLTGCGPSYALPAADKPSDSEALTEEQIAEMQETLDTVDACITKNEDFAAASPEDRKTIAEEMIEGLERLGRIEADSVQFDAESNRYRFVMSGGGEIFVDLNDEDPENTKLASIRKKIYEEEQYAEADAQGIEDYEEKVGIDAGFYMGKSMAMANMIRRPDFGSIRRPYREGDKTLLFLEDTGFNFCEANADIDAEEWSKGHLNTTVERNVTMNTMRNNLDQYDMVLIRCHGVYNFVTGAPQLTIHTDMGYFQTDAAYREDMLTGRISAVYSLTQGEAYINPKFFSYYYDETATDSLKGTGIFIASCYSYRYESDALVSAFTDSGADFVIGASDSIDSLYSCRITNVMMFWLLLGRDVKTALGNAERLIGAKDSDGASYDIHSGGDFCLFHLTDEAQEAIDAKVNGTETAEAAETEAPAATTAAPEPDTKKETQPPKEEQQPQKQEPSEPDEPAAEKPPLYAVCQTSVRVSRGTAYRYYQPGDRAEVYDYRADGCFSDNSITVISGSEGEFTGSLSSFILLPDEKYIASLSDAELKKLAAALYFQYADLFRQFAWTGGTLHLEGTNDIRQTENGAFERLTPARTWDDLMNEMHKYFTEDYVVPDMDIGIQMREIDGCLWRVNGIGQIAMDTHVYTDSIRSRTDNEIVFDMRVTREITDTRGDPKETTAETFIIALDDGMWKCKQIPFEWNMA